MPEFILDTSGTDANGVCFAAFSEFTQGYIEALFFTNQSCFPMVEFFEPESQAAIAEGQADGVLPNDAGFSDLDPDTLFVIHSDCQKFQQDARALLSQAYARGYDKTQAGRDFLFTRNGHGVGFWDREILDDSQAWIDAGRPRVGEPGWDAYAEARSNSLGRQLTAVAKRYGEFDVCFVQNDESPTGYGYVSHY